MSAASGGKAPPQLLSTHPSDQSRIANLQAQQAEVQPCTSRRKHQGWFPSARRKPAPGASRRCRRHDGDAAGELAGGLREVLGPTCWPSWR